MRPPASVIPPASARPIGEMPLGTWVRISALLGGRDLARRLLGLGLRVGSEVEILHRRGGGVVVSTGENRIALGAGVAERILVEVIRAEVMGVEVIGVEGIRGEVVGAEVIGQ